MSEQIGNNNFADYERTAQAALDANQAVATEQAAFETRRGSEEVRALNDRAELEIFGSQGRTYVNPESGMPIATPEKPITGKVNDMLVNRRYGKTSAEREASATAYVESIRDLVDDGFELSQAKLVMDKRDERAAESVAQQNLVAKITAREIANGVSPTDAHERALRRIAPRTKDEVSEEGKVKDLIRKEGIYSVEEYDTKVGTRTAGSLRTVPAPYAPTIPGTAIPETTQVVVNPAASKLETTAVNPISPEPQSVPELEVSLSETREIPKVDPSVLTPEQAEQRRVAEAQTREYALLLPELRYSKPFARRASRVLGGRLSDEAYSKLIDEIVAEKMEDWKPETHNEFFGEEGFLPENEVEFPWAAKISKIGNLAGATSGGTPCRGCREGQSCSCC